MKKIAAVMLTSIMLCSFPSSSHAATALALNEQVDLTLKKLYDEIPGSKMTLQKAKGVVVFPGIWKGGITLGGEYGEGVLRINNKTVEYYSVTGLSLGFQLGLQKQRVILAFMDDTSLNAFRSGDGWEFGADGSVALISTGVDGGINSTTHNLPIVVFVIGQKGLMGNLTAEGYKINHIKK